MVQNHVFSFYCWKSYYVTYVSIVHVSTANLIFKIFIMTLKSSMRMSTSLKFNSTHLLSKLKILSFFFVINSTCDQLSYLYTLF